MSAPKHTSFPPSQLDRVLACPGSYAMESALRASFNNAAKKDNAKPAASNVYADEGSAAHQLAQWALTDGNFDARAYLGQNITVYQRKSTPYETSATITADAAMCDAVQKYVDHVRARIAAFKKDKKVKNVTLRVEQRLDTSGVLGIPNQSGIADTLIVVEYKDGSGYISVEDLKYGRGVPVAAKDNGQLMTYAAAALAPFAQGLRVDHVGLVIHQPRLGHVDEHVITAKELRAFAATAKAGVARALAQQAAFQQKGVSALTLSPAKKPCQFCRARGTCPAFKAAQTQAPKNRPKKPGLK